MRRILKILAIAVVLVLAGTYAIYVLDYKGNYNLSIAVQMNVDSTGAIALTEFDAVSSPTSPVQFWDLFRGQPSEISGKTYYRISFELDQGGLKTSHITKTIMADGESKFVYSDFNNIAPGDATLKVTVSDYAGASLYEKTYSVVVG